MSKKLNTSVNKEVSEKKQDEDVTSASLTQSVLSMKANPKSKDDLKRVFENGMQDVLKGLDEGKNKTMDYGFVKGVMETSLAGKMYAQVSGKTLNVPDISFDDQGVMQVNMESYDPKEDVLAKHEQKVTAKRLDPKPVKEQDDYGDVARDFASRNPVSMLVKSAKSLSKGDAATAAKQFADGIPIVNMAKTAGHAAKVHESRVKNAEALQGRVLAATGLDDQKTADAGMDY